MSLNRAFGLIMRRNITQISRIPQLSSIVYMSSDSHVQNSVLSRTQPRVYLLNQHKEPSVEFDVAMMALRAYSLFERPETVEVVLKCNMKYKKVCTCMNAS